MPRPLRPNTYDGPRDRAGANKSHRPWLSTSQKQESLKERKQRLHEEAVERQRAWDDLSTSAKLKALASRPGESKKQRERLEALVAKEVPLPAAPKKTADADAPTTPGNAAAPKKAKKAKKGK